MTDMHEIDGYPGYFVSDSGRVYSIVAGYSGKRGDLERLAKMHGVSRYVVSRVLQGVLS